MPEAGTPCPNPRCKSDDEYMKIAGVLCGDCLKHYFTYTQREVIIHGADANLDTGLSESDLNVLQDELLAQVERIKAGDGLEQVKLSEYPV